MADPVAVAEAANAKGEDRCPSPLRKAVMWRTNGFEKGGYIVARSNFRNAKLRVNQRERNSGEAAHVPIRNELSIFLADYRHSKGWTLDQMSKEIGGIGSSTLSKLESGQQANVWQPNRKKLASFFGFDIFELQRMAHTLVVQVPEGSLPTGKLSIEDAIRADNLLSDEAKQRIFALVEEARTAGPDE